MNLDLRTKRLETRVKELETRVKELETRVKELETRPPVEVHHHYHQPPAAPTVVSPLYWPELPPVCATPILGVYPAASTTRGH